MLPRLKLPSAARFEGLLESLRLPRVRDRRAAPALLALALVAGFAVLGARLLTSRIPGKGGFPRKAQDLGAAALDAQLKAAVDRLDADPEDLHALVEAGTLHFLKGEDSYRTSINELETARRLGSVEPRIFYYLGVMYQEAGLLQYAIDNYERFIRNFPDDREARLLLGKLLYQTGRFEDAAVQYQSLKSPKGAIDPVVEENLGLSLLALKRYDEAARSFDALLSRPAFEPRARFYLGEVAFEQNRFDQAREHLSRASAAGAVEGVEPVSLWAAVASNDQKLEDWAAAKEHWEKVLQLDPKSAKAKTELGKVKPKLAAAQKKAADAAKKAAAEAAKKNKKK
ncbi:MAG: tetratricopeptide repeat protein [Elusimicrobia bacterium]|nr:tetratricopeptide repeat protein [Elusimicrobiota bacterium]